MTDDRSPRGIHRIPLQNSGTHAHTAPRGRSLRRIHRARHRRGAPRSTAAVTVLSAGILAVVAGCGRSAPPAPPARPAPAETSVAVRAPTVTAAGELAWTVTEIGPRDPEAVLVAAAQVLYSYAPVVDDSARQAVDRARPLLSRAYQQQVGTSTTAMTRFTGSTWQRWRADRAVITATAEMGGDDHPPDTATTHPRVVSVTQTVHAITPAGPTATARKPIALYMVAGRTDTTAAWRVTQLAVR